MRIFARGLFEMALEPFCFDFWTWLCRTSGQIEHGYRSIDWLSGQMQLHTHDFCVRELSFPQRHPEIRRNLDALLPWIVISITLSYHGVGIRLCFRFQHESWKKPWLILFRWWRPKEKERFRNDLVKVLFWIISFYFSSRNRSRLLT